MASAAPRNPSLCLCAKPRSKLALRRRPGLGSCSWMVQEFSGGSIHNIHMSVDQLTNEHGNMMEYDICHLRLFFSVNPENPQEMGMQTRILRVPKWHSSLFSASARVVNALQLGTIEDHAKSREIEVNDSWTT